MAKKIKLNKSDIESIRDIVELLTKRKVKKRKSKRKKGKGISTKKEQQFLDNTLPKMFGGSILSGLINTPNKSIITETTTKPSTDWDDMFKKLLDAQTKAYTTPSGLTPTGKTLSTPASKVSSSSTPGNSMLISSSISKPSIKTVTKNDLAKPSSRIVSDIDSSDYEKQFDKFQKSAVNALKPPESFYETDLEDAINKQMPPLAVDESKAASAAVSLDDSVKQLKNQQIEQVSSQLVETSLIDSLSELQKEIQNELVEKNKKQLDENKNSSNESSNDDDPGEEEIQVVQQPIGKPFLIDNEKPKKRLWNTGLKFSYISYPMIPKPGAKGVQYTYQVAMRQDGSVWMLKDGNNEWTSLTQTFRSDTAMDAFDVWADENDQYLKFPEEQNVELPKSKGRKAKVYEPKKEKSKKKSKK